MKHKAIPNFIALLCALLPLSACATSLSGRAIDGKVTEEGTNKPISGAIVVARWSGHLASWGHGKTVCYHVLSTTSDENGDYRLPTWKKDITEDWQKNIRPETVLIDAYKPSYGLPTVPSQKREIVLLKPFAGTREERLEYLVRILGNTSCGAQDKSEENLIPLRRSLYKEAQALARTEDDRKAVEAILYRLEILELGFEEASKRHIDRLKRK